MSLGCPKNTVDGEVMLGSLQRAGCEVVEDAEAADTLIVNTCAFIEDAKVESLDVSVGGPGVHKWSRRPATEKRGPCRAAGTPRAALAHCPTRRRRAGHHGRDTLQVSSGQGSKRAREEGRGDRLHGAALRRGAGRSVGRALACCAVVHEQAMGCWEGWAGAGSRDQRKRDTR